MLGSSERAMASTSTIEWFNVIDPSTFPTAILLDGLPTTCNRHLPFLGSFSLLCFNRRTDPYMPKPKEARCHSRRHSP